jgi:hypothetical protein
MANGNVEKNPQYIVKQYTDENSVVNDIEPSSADDAVYLMEFNVTTTHSNSASSNYWRIQSHDFYEDADIFNPKDKTYYRRQPMFLHINVISSFNTCVGQNRNMPISFLHPCSSLDWKSTTHPMGGTHESGTATSTVKLKVTLIPPYLVDDQR